MNLLNDCTANKKYKSLPNTPVYDATIILFDVINYLG